MTGAEFKTIREGLGLMPSWIAKEAGVSQRKVSYWESGRYPVPKLVINMITKIEKLINNAATEALSVIADKKAKKVVLVRYAKDEDLRNFAPCFKPLPVSCHAAMLNRIRLSCAEHHDVYICYFIPEKYEEWLGEREDTSSMRAAWAAMQI